MNENKVLAAILTIAASTRDIRQTSQEVGKEHWRKALKDYEQILATLEQNKKNSAFDQR